MEGEGKERKEFVRFLPRTWCTSVQLPPKLGPTHILPRTLQPRSAGPAPPSNYTRDGNSVTSNVRAAWSPCSGRSGEGAHLPAPNPTQAFPDLSPSPALGPRGLRHGRTSSPFASGWVDDTFLRRGRKGGQTAFNPADRGVDGERGGW